MYNYVLYRKNFVEKQMKAMLFFDSPVMAAWNGFIVSTELVFDSMTTVSYNIESFCLLNCIARNFNTMGIGVVVVFKTSINFRASFPKNVEPTIIGKHICPFWHM